MFSKLSLMVSFMLVTITVATNFTFNGFSSANLTLSGLSQLTPNGLLQLTNTTTKDAGRGFYPNPFTFKNSSNGSAFSFSTSFVFAVRPTYPTLGGLGIVFVIAPNKDFSGSSSVEYLGIFNQSNNGKSTNHIFCVEIDTILNFGFYDIDANHIGIDIDSFISADAASASYYDDKLGAVKNLTLISGDPMQLWVEYDGLKKHINVTLAPVNVTKPIRPLLSYPYDLSQVVLEDMYVGFSSAAGQTSTSNYILGWSFSMNSLQATALNLSLLPKLPRVGPEKVSAFFTIGMPLLCASFIIGMACGLVYYVRRKRKFAEVLEDWELDYGPHRFKFKDLYVATKGFDDKELLGAGGFGKVYRGVLPNTKMEIAVKRVYDESRQGMKEFVAEIVSIGRMRHRNLVQLFGYCRRKGELLLVYDYMSNGSLDKYLYDDPRVTLNWDQRFRVIKGVASGLLYLHEGWEQVVIHRDIKASNVLLDGDLNGRLGDFGLARLYDHGTNPQTTHVVGTMGYLAPEHARNGKATTSTDVYSFGAFLLEVACGRRPIEPMKNNVPLVEWVFSHLRKGEILEARDPKLGKKYIEEEVELVLKLGLVCCHREPAARPSMRQVLQFLEGDLVLPDLDSISVSSGQVFSNSFGNFVMSSSCSTNKLMMYTQSSIAESILSQGR